MRSFRPYLVLPFAVSLVLLASSAFVVREWERALVVEFGRISEVISQPGLYLKKPFLQRVIKVEGRVINYDIEPREVITRDKKRLTVDTYALWRVSDPKVFVESTRGSRQVAEARLDDVVYSVVRDVIGSYELMEVVSQRRDEVIEEIKRRVSSQVLPLGIEVVDVRVKRADLPETTEQAVYARMRSERERIAASYRAEGEEMARRIRSEADRDAQIILAEARMRAELIKGEADAEALRIYRRAYSMDPDLFRFYRVMASYAEVLSGDVRFVLTTESELLRYIKEGWRR